MTEGRLHGAEITLSVAIHLLLAVDACLALYDDCHGVDLQAAIEPPRQPNPVGLKSRLVHDYIRHYPLDKSGYQPHMPWDIPVLKLIRKLLLVAPSCVMLRPGK